MKDYKSLQWFLDRIGKEVIARSPRSYNRLWFIANEVVARRLFQMQDRNCQDYSFTDQPSSVLMQQYNSIKKKYPDAILLFRIGEYYETFGDDAEKFSSICNITLTHRTEHDGHKLALAGFHFLQLDIYLPRLVRAGNRVAVCDQLDSL